MMVEPERNWPVDREFTSTRHGVNLNIGTWGGHVMRAPDR